MAGENAKRDENYVTTLLAVSNVDEVSNVRLWADPTTHRLLVDVTGAGGGGTSIADDSAFTPGTTEGTPAFGFFDDVAPDSVNEGDTGALRMSGNRVLYTQIRDAAGNERGLNVTADGYITTLIEGSALSALVTISGAIHEDDGVFNPGASEVFPMGAFFDDVAPDSVNEGDIGAPRMSGNRVLYSQIRDAAGNERGVNVTASNQLNVAESGDALTALQLIDDVVYVDDTAFTPATSKVAMIGAQADDSGTDSVDEGDVGGLRMSTNRNLNVRIRDNAGNERGLNIDANGALAATVTGNVAHDAVDAGNPIKVGGKALTAQPTAVAASDRVDGMFDVYGRQITMAALREMKGAQKTSISSSTSETTVVTADGTYKLDVYGVIVTNTSATGTKVAFKDSTGGTTRFNIGVPAGETRGFMVPMDAGHNQNAANNNWTATCSDSVAAIEITMMFVKNL